MNLPLPCTSGSNCSSYYIWTLPLPCTSGSSMSRLLVNNHNKNQNHDLLEDMICCDTQYATKTEYISSINKCFPMETGKLWLLQYSLLIFYRIEFCLIGYFIWSHFTKQMIYHIVKQVYWYQIELLVPLNFCFQNKNFFFLLERMREDLV